MIGSTKILATAALTSFALALAGLAAIPSHGSARSVDYGMGDLASERIGAAFAFAGAAEPDGTVLAAARQVQKGDLRAPACAGGEGAAAMLHCLPAVASVTVGYQAGESTTVLVRMPAPEVASR